MAEGAYEFDREARLVESNQSEFSLAHNSPGLPRGFALLPDHQDRLGTDDTASDALADLARVCISSRVHWSQFCFP